MLYEWDPRKALANAKKHGVSFPEAATVFLDPLAVTFDDPDHSTIEQRSITIGRSNARRLPFISLSERNDCIRIIGARRATRKETYGYQEGKF